MFKTVFTKKVSGITRNHVGVENLQARRTTNRYGRKGTMLSKRVTKALLAVSRVDQGGTVINGKEYKGGQFCPRQNIA
jgi:hypothetical protein